MKKDTKNILWIVGIILALSNPFLFILGIIVYFVYLGNKGKDFNSTLSKMKEKYKNSDKTHNYEVIDTSAEVLESKIVDNNDDWSVIKEYKH